MDACSIGNLGDKAQNTRLRLGVIGLGVALLLAVTLIGVGTSPAVRALLFVPFFVGAFGAFQGLFRTCTYAAKNDVLLTDAGEEKVLECEARSRVRAEGRKVMLGSILTASAATILCVAM